MGEIVLEEERLRAAEAGSDKESNVLRSSALDRRLRVDETLPAMKRAAQVRPFGDDSQKILAVYNGFSRAVGQVESFRISDRAAARLSREIDEGDWRILVVGASAN